MIHKVLKIVKWIGLGFASLALVITLLLLIFRKDIQQYALSQLDNFIDTKVYVYDMDVTFWKTFPSISIQFDRVLIKDEMLVEGTIPDTLLYAEQIFLKLNTSDFWKGDYTVKSIDINNARLGLRVNDEGKVNYDVLKKDSTKTNNDAFQFVLDNVNIINLDFTYDNYITDQHYRSNAKQLNLFGSFNEKRFDLRTKADLFVKKIRSKSVVLITNKNTKLDIVITIDKINNAFILEESSVMIENLPFLVSAKLGDDSLNFSLKANAISLTDFAKNFNQADLEKLSEFQGTGKVDFNLAINGSTKLDQQPLVEALFSVKNGSLKDPISNIQLSQIDVEGSFTNNYGKNEELNLHKIKFISLNSPFDGNLVIRNFEQPEVKSTIKGNLDLATVYHFFPINSIQAISGSLYANASVHLRLNDPKKDAKNITIYSSKGDFDLKKINLIINDDLPTISNLTGKISTSGDNAIFNQLSIQTGQSKIELSGSIKHIMSYFADKTDLNVDAIVDVKQLYSADFYSNKASAPATTKNFGAYLLPKNLKGKVILSIEKFYLDNHLFESISSKFVIDNRKYATSLVKFNHLGTESSGSLFINEQKPGQIEVAGKLNTHSINFKQLFKEWNNFEQQVITDQQISGNAEIELGFYLPFSLQSGLQKDKLEATARFTIRNGALKNVETFKAITDNMRESNAVRSVLGQNIDDLENRLLNLTFETLENTVIIKNSKISLPKMSIRSNALDIDISGWHAFNNDIDYHLDFRLRDLKFRKKDSEFGDIIDDGTGQRIFLHLFGNLDNLKFKWDGDANKVYKKEQREEEKQQVKSMLKTELGLFNKDTTIGTFIKEEKPKEKIEIIFDDKQPEESLPEEKKKLKKLFGMDLEKMREENKNEKELEFTIGD